MNEIPVLKIDIDGVLCNNTYGKTNEAVPCREAISLVKKYRDMGTTIIIETGRPWSKLKLTKEQLCEWGVLYDILIMGKIHADWIIDDRSMKSMREFDLAVEFARDNRYDKFNKTK